MNRPTRIIATALCNCGWQDAAAGCQGRAAQHHDRTGHEVRIDVIVFYGEPTTQEEELPGMPERIYIGDPQ